MNNNRLRRILPAFLLITGANTIALAGNGLETTRLPVGISQDPLVGPYDVLKVFQNPSLLANQPQTVSAGIANQLVFGGMDDIWAVGVGYMAKPGAMGTYGAALLASGMFSQPVAEVNLFGNETGYKVSQTAYRLYGAAVYQWQFLSMGVGLGYAEEAFTGARQGKAAAGTMIVDAGALAMNLGILDVGFTYHNRSADAAGSISAGGVLKLTGPVKGSLGASANIPLGSGISKPFTTVGASWHAGKMLEVNLGALVPSGVSGAGGAQGRLGFNVFYRSTVIGYLFSVPFTGGIGTTHTLGLGYSFGPERPREAAGPGVLVARRPIEKSHPAVPLTLGGDRTLAVANFEAQNLSSGDAGMISDMFRTDIIRDGYFSVIEKASMEKVLQEQTFQQSGCTTQECAVKLGKILNVRYLVLGSFGKLVDLYVVNIRVVDVETAKAIYSDDVQTKTTSEVPAAVHVLASRLIEAVKSAQAP